MTPFLSVQQLTKTFRNGPHETVALQGISLEIADGEFIALVGPSGSGKTTLLNLIGFLDRSSSGTILFDGQETSHFSPSALAEIRLRKIGFVFQDYNLISTLTAVENVEYVLWLQGMPSRQRRSQAVRLLERVGLGSFLYRRPHQLSRGQQQRVAVCRAIAHRPKIILGDEMTANLDHKTGFHLMDLLKQLNQTEGVTFLYATHDPAMMESAQRIIYLEDGKLIRDEKR